MSTSPRISVVIPTRNRAGLLGQSLDSLVGQTLDPSEFEVVVIDDGSDDDTARVCESASTRLPLTYHRIAPSGISAAKNLGVFASAAPIVFFFDDDDVADPDLLSQHLLTHDEHPDQAIAVLGRTVWAPHLQVTEVMTYVTDVGKFLFDYSFIEHGDVLDHTFFWGGRASCKRMLLAQEGIFDPEFRFGSEDIELAYRLKRHGFKVVYNAHALSLMNRSITFDEFCRRCERQGRSQHHFGEVLHGHDPEIRRYCDVDNAAERFEAVRATLGQLVAEVAVLEEAAAAGRLDGDGRRRLHGLYGDAFRAHRLAGIVAAREGR